MLACCAAILSGCIEYRWRQNDGQDRYIGVVHSVPRLDPKLGPKAKLWLAPRGSTWNPYMAGRFSRRRLTINAGVILYLSPRSSVEIGARREIWTTNNPTFGDTIGSFDWEDIPGDFIYFGGMYTF